MSGAENPQAFPFAAEYGHPAACGGMTLRDWFAGQAMLEAVNTLYRERCGGYEEAALIAYEFADAMLAARTQSKDTPQ